MKLSTPAAIEFVRKFDKQSLDKIFNLVSLAASSLAATANFELEIGNVENHAGLSSDVSKLETLRYELGYLLDVIEGNPLD